MAKIYTPDEARERFGDLLEQVRAGERVVISLDGEPIAEMSPYRSTEESFDERWARLEGEGRLVAARPGATTLGIRPVAKRPGALRRFLEQRD